MVRKNNSKSFTTLTQHLIRIYNMINKWYKVKITPVDKDQPPHEFRIQTANIKNTLKKYTQDKEGNITAIWEILK